MGLAEADFQANWLPGRAGCDETHGMISVDLGEVADVSVDRWPAARDSRRIGNASLPGVGPSSVSAGIEPVAQFAHKPDSVTGVLQQLWIATVLVLETHRRDGGGAVALSAELPVGMPARFPGDRRGPPVRY